MNDIQTQLLQASTSASRSAVIENWLSQSPNSEEAALVYKEWSNKDKGVAKLLKDYLMQIKRREQQAQALEKWSQLAEQLLAQTKMPIADALAWQRDAAKDGAPLSQPALATLRDKLMERVTQIEDLQNVANVQKEAAILLAQRLELLSAKTLSEVEAANTVLQEDVASWMQKTDALMQDSNWSCVDPRFVLAMEQASQQLQVVWGAFVQAWGQTQEAMRDEQAPLPPVPHWAGQIQTMRKNYLTQEEQEQNAEEKARRAALREQLKAQREEAEKQVHPILATLEQELAQGHGKASAEAAQKLRDIFKSTEAILSNETQAKVRAAVAAAGELTGWQRWRADQLREELLVKAQALLAQPLKPRQQQESLRQLREEWKRTDLGGIPNHGLWRKFDEACTQAYQPVQEWVSSLKEQEAEQVKLRETLIEELERLAQTPSGEADFKQLYRKEGDYQKRWREGGHVSEKQYDSLHARFKAAMSSAFSSLHEAQNASIQTRKALIEQSKALAQDENFSISHVKALQEQWRTATQAITLDRKMEQKLWEQFKKPIDAAFARKDEARENERKALSQAEAAVFEAAQALEQAAASTDAQAIQAAMTQLELATRPPATKNESVSPATPVPAVKDEADKPVSDGTFDPSQAHAEGQPSAASSTQEMQSMEPAASDNGESHPAISKTEETLPAQTSAIKKVIAVRGDDRPGAKVAMPSSRAEAGKPLAGKSFAGKSGRKDIDVRRRNEQPRHAKEFASESAPALRLSVAAQNAVKRARESAQKALRQLSSQAHGQALAALVQAWRERDATKLPPAADLGKAVKSNHHKLWGESLSAAAQDAHLQALLRLEMAAELPSPAQHQLARRSLQLQILTQKHGQSPLESWPQDVAQVLTAAHDEESAQRLLHVLKKLL